MRKSVKQLSILLTALGLSTPAFADGLVQVPSQQGGFKVGIDALYLRPTNSDLNYVTKLSTFPSPTLGENIAVEPNYNWGVYGYIGYLFPCTGNDLTLAYTYLHTKDNALALGNPDPDDATPGFTLLAPPVSVGGITAIYDAGSKQGELKLNLNAVDLEGGQRFKTLGYDMRMFAGLRYADVDYNLNTVIYPRVLSGQEPLPPSAQQFDSQFKGLGPRLGVDGHYGLSHGFGIAANLSTSLLIGHLDSYFSSSVNLGAPVENHYFEAKSDSQTRVVPVLEGKLGLDYAFPIANTCNQSALVFEAGYQATHYFNIADHARVTEHFEPPTISYENSQNSTSDVGFDGIYFGVKYFA